MRACHEPTNTDTCSGSTALAAQRSPRHRSFRCNAMTVAIFHGHRVIGESSCGATRTGSAIAGSGCPGAAVSSGDVWLRQGWCAPGQATLRALTSPRTIHRHTHVLT